MTETDSVEHSKARRLSVVQPLSDGEIGVVEFSKMEKCSFAAKGHRNGEQS